MSRASGWIAYGHGVYQVLEGKAQLAGRPKRLIPVGVDVDHLRPDRTAELSLRRQLGGKRPPHPSSGSSAASSWKKGSTCSCRSSTSSPCPGGR